MKAMYSLSLVLLVLCLGLIPSLCFGRSWNCLDPEKDLVSIPTENELTQTDREIVQKFEAAPSEHAEEETGAEEIPQADEEVAQNFEMMPSEPSEEETGEEENL
jgi:hypothetical protein